MFELERRNPATAGSEGLGRVRAPGMTCGLLFPVGQSVLVFSSPNHNCSDGFKVNVEFYKLSLAFLVNINVML